MSATPYDIKTEKELVFSFVSEGRKGRIGKLVKYQQMYPGIFNLAFGDRIGNSNSIDVQIATDNGDMVKVISTVIRTIELFFEKYPDQAVFFQGSTMGRTNFYHRIIKTYGSQFKDYYFYGANDELIFEPFSSEKEYLFFDFKITCDMDVKNILTVGKEAGNSFPSAKVKPVAFQATDYEDEKIANAKKVLDRSGLTEKVLAEAHARGETTAQVVHRIALQNAKKNKAIQPKPSKPDWMLEAVIDEWFDSDEILAKKDAEIKALRDQIAALEARIAELEKPATVA